MKKILALLASIVLFLSPCVAQQSGTAIAVDPTGRLAFLNTNILGQIFLAQAGPGITNAQSGVAVALNPSGTLAYLNVDSTGGLIVSGGGTVKSVALTAPGNFTVTGSPVTATRPRASIWPSFKATYLR